MAVTTINGPRLSQRLVDIAKIGARTDGGCNRQALTKEDSEARLVFVRWCQSLGLQIRRDAIGNIFCRMVSKSEGAKTLLIGSHLDTQPNGGKYDGIYGVLAGLEVVESLIEQKVELPFHIDIVVWTNEEGCRFPFAMMGSAVWNGSLALEDAYQLTDDDGQSVQAALTEQEQVGDFNLPIEDVLGAIELHIEQGPVLEAEHKAIGIVTGVQQMSRWSISLFGEETHAGPTPMAMRKDPVQPMAQLISALYGAIDHFDDNMRLTIGKIDTIPGSPNTVPGKVSFTLDLRHPNPDVHEALENWCLDRIDELESAISFKLHPEKLWQADAVAFDDNLVNAVEQSASLLNLPAMKLVSGAGHDSVNTAAVVPTTMIFVPCENGISHNPAESITDEQIKNGANTLFQTVLNLA
jgi:N-carbamoyl-L-amino-acid hydrolase